MADASPRQIPHSVEAEEAVLGSVLTYPEALYDVVTFLKSDDFYIVRNRWIWEAILDLHERRAPIDFLTVTQELERKTRLEEVGGPAYVGALINATPTPLHAAAYGRMIEETALRRRLIAAAGEIVQLAYELDLDIDQVIDRSEQHLFAVSERRISRDLRPIRDVITDYFERIQYLSDHRGEVVGVPTGFIDLDRLLGGLQKSDLIIVAARPGIGKTSLLLSMALTAARKHNQRVAIFSLEMSAEQLVQRLIASETGIDQHRLRMGDLHDDDWPLFMEATGRLSEAKVWIDDTPSLTSLQMRTKCRRLYAEHGLDLIIIDYLQLMQGDFRSENRVQEISNISRNLKSLARELNVPVMAAAQLSRAVEQRQDKRPILSDLRESGSIEQDADVVMFIYRDEVYNPETEKKNIAEIHIAKHRNGPTGMVELYFRSHLTQFANAAIREVTL